ncbi:MAG: hypothetical protein M3P83_05570 [Actinomycetota bacterium]|nr:hypothetical protein [Actinomycetota bacterium]
MRETSDNLELHLVGSATPDGEIRARDLAVLADALQELRLRIGRDLINKAGPGRTRQYMDELTEIRLAAIASGSTVLTFAQGPTDKLDGMLVEERQLEQRFRDVVEAISRDERPDWATDLIAESAAKLVDGLKATAPRAIMRCGAGSDVTFETSRIHRETWTTGRVQTDEFVTAKGRLERVDLRTHEFRVRDDVGNAVDLLHVVGDTVAAKLVGQWVAATGRATLNRAGRLVALQDARVEAVDDPTAPYVDRAVVSVETLVAGPPGPDPASAIDLDDEEFATFLAAARS